MTGLVEQLQADALNEAVSVSTLLRKVKVAAVKLQLSDTVEWADNELNGYDEKVPPYRVMGGRCMGLDAWGRWKLVGGDPKIVDLLSHSPIGQPISGLEEICSHEGGDLIVPVPRTIAQGIIDANPGCCDVALHVTRAEVISVVDHVRNLVLDWALDLERAGIKGEGLSFSPSEQKTAAASHLNIKIEGANARLNVNSVDVSSNAAE